MSSLVAVDWPFLLPVLAPAGGAILVLLLDAVAPALTRVHAAVGLVALLVGAAAAVPAIATTGDRPLRTLCLPAPEGACLYEAGAVAGALQVGALLSALVVLLLVWPSHHDRRALRGGPAVVVCLVLGATAGAAGVAAAHDLGSWLVCLELATLPAIALVALRGTRAAGRGALALLTTSLVSFSMVALGAALWLVATGEAVFASGAAQQALASSERRPVLLLGVLLLVAGLGFKLSLVPFHAWTPAAYAGGSEPVAAFLAATSKVAALAALLVVLRPLAQEGSLVLVAVGVLAAGSMTLGNVLALVQDDPVRLLAWSTVAQAGWVVLPLAALNPGSAPAAAAYLLAYVIATLVAFVVVHILGPSSSLDGPQESRRTLVGYTGLLRTRPLLGAALGLALLSLAGLPPGLVGLVAKVFVLRPVVGESQWGLALVAVANAVLGIAVYLRWFGTLLRDPDAAGSGTAARPAGRRLRRADLAALLLCSTALVVTSVMPQLLFGLVG
ncbi:proton-conducting transporter transmembrane domain-containing protein [Pedococcus sp. 5OH_020]|uniref:proton-conducting transporter transmembrane domain-containing protein n=1 Tax=Pedococcus sp. 5OH_020 TaxID=2989814 RepID=UPI0022E9AE10|nr:proton-conducting transporter membrane subunit [Pedococcus sp. 5OH_020]